MLVWPQRPNTSSHAAVAEELGDVVGDWAGRHRGVRRRRSRVPMAGLSQKGHRSRDGCQVGRVARPSSMRQSADAGTR